MYAPFWDAIRPMFRGNFSKGQFDGLTRILAETQAAGIPDARAAYIFATAHHETGRRMQPIREGFAKTNAGAISAVTNLHAKGIIRTNYALPHSNGHSYYGRGLVQITWRENYEKLSSKFNKSLADDPDLALEWRYALPILIHGMQEGFFRSAGKGRATLERYIRFDPYTSNDLLLQHFVAARNIINGDVRKNGSMVAGYAMNYYLGLRAVAEYSEGSQNEDR